MTAWGLCRCRRKGGSGQSEQVFGIPGVNLVPGRLVQLVDEPHGLPDQVGATQGIEGGIGGKHAMIGREEFQTASKSLVDTVDGRIGIEHPVVISQRAPESAILGFLPGYGKTGWRRTRHYQNQY